LYALQGTSVRVKAHAEVGERGSRQSKFREGLTMNGVIMKKIFVCIVALSLGFTNVSAVDAKRMPKVKCPNVWKLTTDAGWISSDVQMADVISFRESRCNHLAHNKLDPVTVEGVKGSLGLFQINLFWISKTSSYPKGFLQTVMKRNLVPTDLFVPEINVAAAEAIIKYNRGNGGCGWQAWNGC
jgi:hypothetical protein